MRIIIIFNNKHLRVMHKRKRRNKEFEVFLLISLLECSFLMSSSVLDLNMYPLTDFWTFGAVGRINLEH